MSIFSLISLGGAAFVRHHQRPICDMTDGWDDPPCVPERCATDLARAAATQTRKLPACPLTAWRSLLERLDERAVRSEYHPGIAAQ